MKRNTILLYTLLTIAFVLSSINSTQIRKHKQEIRPNVHDIRNLVRPLIQGAYKPIEVDSLAEPEQNINIDMLNAEIVGQKTQQQGLVDKPTLYDTIVTPQATSILHGEESVLKGFNSNSAITSLLRASESEMTRLSEGQMAIPVKLGNKNIVNDAVLSNYETPLFLSTNQKKLPTKKNSITIPKTPMLTPSLVATSAADAKRIKSSLSAAKSLKQKKNALLAERKRLQNDSKAITGQIAAQINSLLQSKRVGQKLDSLLQKYTLKMKKDELKKIKLVDRVQIKKELKEKLLKEVEGLRTNGNQYSHVSMVDPSDLLKIVKNIKKKLGN